MGIDIHALNFLAFAKKSGVDFSSILTLGRQAIHVSEPEVLRFLRLIGLSHVKKSIWHGEHGGIFCEELLKLAFKTMTVDSIDASNYEGATIVHNLNKPIVPHRRYSVIMDFGCLEHIFNVSVALSNIIEMCDANGHILHVLPSNNLCGHGYFQFSPELFFGIYAAERGFKNTVVFVAELGDITRWYRVRSPREIGARVSITTTDEMYVLVMTQKTADAISPGEQPPEQFDYRVAWRAGTSANTQHQDKVWPRQVLKRMLFALPGAYELLNRVRRWNALRKTNLAKKVGDVEVVYIKKLIAK